MPVTINLAKAWKHQQHGDIVAVLTWINDSRALVLLPAHRRDAGWYVVDESAAWRWGVDHADADVRSEARKHVAWQSSVACMQIGIEATTRNRARVANIVTGWLPDLVRMPTSPLPELGPARGEITLKLDGQVVREEEVRLPTNEGSTYG